jgi:hypothetical protein
MLTFLALAIFVHPLYTIGCAVPAVVLTIMEFIICSDSDDSKIFAFVYIGKLKRVKTEFSRFYVTVNNKKRSVLYQDKFFYMKSISYTGFENMDKLKEWVKHNVEYTCSNIKAKSDLKKELMLWNGHIDKQVERNEKLNEVL